MTGHEHAALLERVDAIAGDLGRLRRRFDSNGTAWTGAYLVDRLVGELESLDVQLAPTAAELYQLFVDECGDEQVALDEALDAVDRRAAQIRRLLRECER